ncbi:MAG: aspartate-semialdehyde dehydrogenase [Candidatus Dormibacteraceae bacterium]
MSNPTRSLSVAVVGATGVVGQEMFRVLEQRAFPIGKLKALASKRSNGMEVRCDGHTVPVEELSEQAFEGVDVALFSAGAGPSLHYAPIAAEAGALVVDNSSAWRMKENIPLVVPEVNPGDIHQSEGIIANPNCCAIPLTVVLEPLRRRAGLRRVVVSTYQSASGAGKELVGELEGQIRAIAEGRPVEHHVYPHQLAHNVVPGGWTMEGEGYNEEEMKLRSETRKILHLPELRIAATCVRVPVPIAHGESVFLETEEPLSSDEARELLAGAPGVVVQDDPAEQLYPTPAAVAGTDEVFVGRIREDISHPRGLDLWVVSDNIRKGAALNSVQLAELLVKSYL